MKETPSLKNNYLYKNVQRMKKVLLAVALGVTIISCNNNPQSESDKLKAAVDSFLLDYNKTYQLLSTRANETQWKLSTYIVEGDTATSNAADRANEALATYTGSKAIIEKTKNFLASKDKLTPIQVQQLEKALYNAGGNPEIVADIVKAHIQEETQALKKLYGFKYILNGDTITTNKIDQLLQSELNLDKRRAVWECSKGVGVNLREPLIKLRELRNKTVQGLNYPDYFTYQVADYGMTTDEMMTLLRKMNKDIYPLFRELHTYARYELAKKYHSSEVPDYLPAHWLPNRWGQDWSDIVNVKGFDLDQLIAEKHYSKEWIVQQAERFYVSMGFPHLPSSFWAKSDLYPLPAGTPYSKNNHATAWHMDLDHDVRSLMSIEPNTKWYETTHHELGHIYYYLSYSTPEVPIILREGANKGYHEALGTMFGFAAMQKPFLEGLGLISPSVKVDTIQTLLKDALNFIVALKWQAGTMSEFEYELYAKNLPSDQFNKRWWEIVKREQGIVPPSERGENYCDAATKTHIIDDPAQYYNYAIASLLQFQFHDYIAKKILHQDVHATNYYGNKEIGAFISGVMKKGGVGDWRVILKDATGEELSARAMLDYFSPLMSYLKKVNKGRKYTLPEVIE